jgi:protein-disulfide isomerase
MERRRLLSTLAVCGLAGCLDAGGGGSGSGGPGGGGGSNPTDTTAPGATDTPTSRATSGSATPSEGGDGTPGGTDDDTPTGTGTETPSLGSLADHPAAADVRDQPRRGSFGKHVILTFEDPSCSRCAAFEQNTVPKIRSNLVEPGKAAFVFRNYPVIYPWGKPATQALEATFARDESAFWDLADHYFSTQGKFSTDNVYERTASFLNDETDLDGEAVATDAREKAYDDAVQADIDAAKAAELGNTTPIVLLFRDGEYVTKTSGSASYTLIANALGES